MRRPGRKVIHTELGREIECTKCHEFWPADAEFFWMYKGQPHSWCKDCYINDPKMIEKKKRFKAKLAAARQRHLLMLSAS